MINHISFGDPINFNQMRKHFPSAGSGNPLDGFSRRPEPKSENDKKFKKMRTNIFIEAIPTIFTDHNDLSMGMIEHEAFMLNL
jgi:hypothetical protein